MDLGSEQLTGPTEEQECQRRRGIHIIDIERNPTGETILDGKMIPKIPVGPYSARRFANKKSKFFFGLGAPDE